MQLSGFTRILFHGSLVALALLAVGLWAAPVSAGPESSPLLQYPPIQLQATLTPPSNSTATSPTPTLTPTLMATSLLPTPTSTPTTTAILEPSTLPPTATVQTQPPGQDIVVPPAGRLDLTFEQLGYDARHSNQDKPRLYYRVDLPDNFQILPTGNYLDLLTSHLPEIPDKPSVLQVEMNGHFVSAITLSADNAISNTARMNLPQGLLRAGRNYIEITLNTSATCEEPGAIVNVLVDENSTVSFGYQQTPYATDLSLYPWPFTERGLLEVPVTIVLPDRSTADDLSVAATIAAGLGQKSGGAIDLRAVLAGDFDSDVHGHHHLIVIGRPDDNALFGDLTLPLPVDSTMLEPGQGVLEEIVSPWNEFRLMLIVSGLDDEGVLKASHALDREAHFLDMRGPIAIVTQLHPSSSESEAPHIPGMTLASLGYEDEIVYGAKPQDYTFYFALPLSWRLEEPPLFVLKFAHADILDPYESVIDINLNGVPIGSTLLDSSNATDGELLVSLPEHRLRAGSNRLRVGVEMNFPGSDNAYKCKVLGDERAWTVISSESEIFLPYATVDLPPDLGLFPYPFSQNFGLDQTLFVLPDQPYKAVFDYLIQLAVRLGSPTGSEYISAHVVYASEASQDIWQDHHLILLGRPTENVLLGEFNPHLPHPFVADSDILEPLVIDSVAFSPEPGRDAGLLEIADSPWNEEYALLAITGTTDEGVRLVVQALLEQTDRLEGNLAVVEPGFDPFSDKADQVSIYTTDTRPPAAIDEEASTTENELEEESTSDNAAFEDDEILLAERWWK